MQLTNKWYAPSPTTTNQVLWLYLVKNTNTTCSQAISELKAALDSAAPEKVLCWVVDGTLDRSLLWKLSWALNSVGHSIVPISTYDWLMGVKHARSMM